MDKDKELNGDAFTYTLIDERAGNRTGRRILAYNGAILIGIIAVYTLYRSYNKLPLIPNSVKKLFQK